MFRAFAFEGLGFLDDVDGTSVTGERSSGASECGDGLGEVVDRGGESPDGSDHLVNLLICGERPLFLWLCLCLWCRGRVGALDARHCERVGRRCRDGYRGQRCVWDSWGAFAAGGAEVVEKLLKFRSVGDGWASDCLV